MKNLKKLVAIGALLGATHGASAFEKTFEPVEKGSAETQGIELINGQLMVKSNGSIGTIETPYTFVGTNTVNFANSGFAVEEMADANSVILDGNDVYFSRASDTEHAYRFSVANKSALNGAPGTLEKIDSNEPISSILAVKDGVVYGRDATGDNVVELGETAASIPSITVPDSLTNTLHSVCKDGIYVVTNTHIEHYNEDGDLVGNKVPHGIVSYYNHTLKDIVAIDNGNVFVLDTDGNLYNNAGMLFKGYTSVSGIKTSKDGKSLLITSQKDGKTEVEAYDTTSGETKSVYSEPVSSKKFFAKKEVVSNGLKYKVNGKKIGYSIVD